MGLHQATHDAPAAGPSGEAILLSTFNGERYLAEQLASFTAQTHTDWQLYWRDDGSSDGTAGVMAGFAAVAPGRCVTCAQGGRLRATRSFLALLRMALPGPAAFFAFSDQDDVWLPEKLAHGVAALRTVPPSRPALYFCGRKLVDATLAPIGEVLAPNRPPGFPASLTQNLAPGCCMMLNRAAATLIASAAVPDGTWHDWWSYIVVSASGGAVIAGNTPDILYRQHSQNLVGEPPGFWRRTAAAVRRGRKPFMTLFWRHIDALRAGPVLLPNQTCALLTVIERGKRGGFSARLKALGLPGFVRQTWAETLLFHLWFLLG
jgi:hypothetical protein